MRRFLISLICIMVSVSLLVPLFSTAAENAGKAEETAAEETKATRTVMFYGIGSNLESFGMLTWNLVQILEADIPEDVNVVVMTGGARYWQMESEYLEGADAIGEDASTQFWICSGRNAENAENGHGKMTLLDGPMGYENASTVNPDTLRAFIDFASENYPAEMYDLFLWDHGNGPEGGFGIDVLYEKDPPMSLGQIFTDTNMISVLLLKKQMKRLLQENS